MEIARSLNQRVYPIRLLLRYEVAPSSPAPRYSGQGFTVMLSRTGVVFETSEKLPVGRLVKLSIDWPVLLENKIALKFEVQGKVLQAEDEQAAVEILSYDFRIRPLARGAAA
jgi:hypothetical protein